MANYNPYSYQNYLPYQNFQQPMMQNTQPQIQNGGVINVQSEQEARDYLVAQGTSVMFINQPEHALYVKTKGFSSMDAPTFDIYDLVKRGEEQKVEAAYADKAEFDELKKEFEKLKKELVSDE